MKTRWWVTGITVAALSSIAIPLARAESKGTPERPQGKLTRVVPQDATREDSGAFDSDEWKQQLTAQDLEAREAAFGRLAAKARHDAAARKALEDWSRNESDAGLAWTSRLILREADRGAGTGMQGGAWQPWNRFRQDFDFGGFARRFEDLDSMFGDLRTEWDELLKNLPNPSSRGATGTESAESMTLESGPDGVTCKITTKVDGQEETREYTANSMEELLEANPELRPKLGSGGPMVWTFPDVGGRSRILTPRRDTGGGLRIIPREPLGLAEVPGHAADPRTDRLGIFCTPVDGDESSKLGLATGEGLHVDSVQPGSIASILGLRAGDVVVEVNGTTIRSSEDVKKVLAERAEGAEVRVAVVGSEGRRTLAWKPSPKKAEEKSKDL
ncbi:MAG: PDZ domain-containing protein [Planctomycetota bacterium]